MLNLSTKLTLNKETVLSPNLCDKFSAQDLAAIGTLCHDGYAADKYSRMKWEKRTQAAMDLAMQVQKDKNFPWPGCSNIAFPLVTIAALQFHSRAYPAIVQGTEVVKMRVIGEDAKGEKTARASRVSTYMSWQVLEEDSSWEEQHDRLLINVPIVGTAFKKCRYNTEAGHNESELVLAQDLVLDYFAKSVENCPRKTHVIPKFRNEVHSGILRGIYRDAREEAWYNQPPAVDTDASKQASNNRRGQTPPQTDHTTPFTFLEQHVDLDLDGDGYAEPYIITFEQSNAYVMRIVTGFDQEADIERTRSGEIISIRKTHYFTKYGFIPSPDGGIYDIGFGVLLGPMNESVNSILNQLVDAGTMSILGGGFLGRGAKIRGGVYTFAPYEWKRVDSSGDDLRKNIVPNTPPEPSAVLFNLLSLLINYVNRVAGTTDPMVGESPGQNTPAETTRSMIEQGQKIYSAVFKRIWRSMKEEFKKLYVLNGIYMPNKKNFGGGQFALREDFLGNPDEVVPSADPNIASAGEQLQQVQMLKAAAASTPGYDPDAVERRFLKALKVDNIDQIYPGIQKTGAPKSEKLQIQELKTQVAMAELQQQQQQFLLSLSEERRMNEAEIVKIVAEIEKMKADVSGDVEDRRINMLNNMLGMMKLRNENVVKRMDVIMKALEVKREQVALRSDEGDLGGLAAAPGDSGSAAGGAPGETADPLSAMGIG